eukprot:Ihof_evm1s365 gene=Ihof_evmTU1s365
MKRRKEEKTSERKSGSVLRTEKKKQRVRFSSNSEGDNLSQDVQDESFNSSSDTSGFNKHTAVEQDEDMGYD